MQLLGAYFEVNKIHYELERVLKPPSDKVVYKPSNIKSVWLIRYESYHKRVSVYFVLTVLFETFLGIFLCYVETKINLKIQKN